jgi:hypothetical protein
VWPPPDLNLARRRTAKGQLRLREIADDRKSYRFSDRPVWTPDPEQTEPEEEPEEEPEAEPEAEPKTPSPGPGPGPEPEPETEEPGPEPEPERGPTLERPDTPAGERVRRLLEAQGIFVNDTGPPPPRG